MPKHECLTITEQIRRSGRSIVYTTIYELLGTSPDGSTRHIDVIEATKIGRKTTYRYEVRKMDLETGHYIGDGTVWSDHNKGDATRTIKEWSTIPYRERYTNIIGTTTSETRFLSEK